MAYLAGDAPVGGVALPEPPHVVLDVAYSRGAKLEARVPAEGPVTKDPEASRLLTPHRQSSCTTLLLITPSHWLSARTSLSDQTSSDRGFVFQPVFSWVVWEGEPVEAVGGGRVAPGLSCLTVSPGPSHQNTGARQARSAVSVPTYFLASCRSMPSGEFYS